MHLRSIEDNHPTHFAMFSVNFHIVGCCVFVQTCLWMSLKNKRILLFYPSSNRVCSCWFKKGKCMKSVSAELNLLLFLILNSKYSISRISEACVTMCQHFFSVLQHFSVCFFGLREKWAGLQHINTLTELHNRNMHGLDKYAHQSA